MKRGNTEPLKFELQSASDALAAKLDSVIDTTELPSIDDCGKMVRGRPKKGTILAALRRSPLAGADLNLARPRIDGRKVGL